MQPPYETHTKLRHAFHHECHERFLRVQSILENKFTLNAFELDQIHQEFDSLVGAARAIHEPKLESLFRTLASFARYLRNAGPMDNATTSFLLLQKGIEHGLRCHSIQTHDAEQFFIEIRQWIKTIGPIMNKEAVS